MAQVEKFNKKLFSEFEKLVKVADMRINNLEVLCKNQQDKINVLERQVANLSQLVQTQAVTNVGSNLDVKNPSIHQVVKADEHSGAEHKQVKGVEASDVKASDVKTSDVKASDVKTSDVKVSEVPSGGKSQQETVVENANIKSNVKPAEKGQKAQIVNQKVKSYAQTALSTPPAPTPRAEASSATPPKAASCSTAAQPTPSAQVSTAAAAKAENIFKRGDKFVYRLNEIDPEEYGLAIGKHRTNVHYVKTNFWVDLTIAVDKVGNENLELVGKTRDAVLAAKQYVMSLMPVTVSLPEVPKRLYGLVIGIKGANISKLRQEHKVDIYIPTDDNKGEGDVLTVYGHQDRVNSATKAILTLVNDYLENEKKRIKPVTVSVPEVPKRLYGLVIGPKGATISKMRQEHKVDIYIPTNDKDGVLTIHGHQDRVNNASKAILALVQDFLNEEKKRMVSKPPTPRNSRSYGPRNPRRLSGVVIINDKRRVVTTTETVVTKATE